MCLFYFFHDYHVRFCVFISLTGKNKMPKYGYKREVEVLGLIVSLQKILDFN